MQNRLVKIRANSCGFVFWFFMVGGCTTTLVPPDHPEHPQTVLVTDYGKHSSLLLPDPGGGLTEYAFGDWNYFALGHKSLLSGLVALIHSPQSALGQRWVPLGADAPDAARQLGAEKTEILIVDANRVAALRDDLNLQYVRHLDGELFNPAEHLYFVRCDEPYNLFHNCNNVTAEWLKKLGVRVEGLALFSRFRVEAPKAPLK